MGSIDFENEAVEPAREQTLSMAIERMQDPRYQLGHSQGPAC